MIHSDGIQVVIRSVTRGTKYKEYEVPSGKSPMPDPKGQWMQRYIQVEPGEKYAITVRTLPNLQATGKPYLVCTWQVDDAREWKRRNALHEGRYGCRWEAFDVKSTVYQTGNRWFRTALEFGSLQVGMLDFCLAV